MTVVVVIVVYLALLVAVGLASQRLARGTAQDFFLASHTIGPFLLLMSVFGTTMTGFAMVGSTGKAYQAGIGVYGLMASWSGLIHSACFFLVGIKLWALGKRYGYLTQCQFFRDRFESNAIGWLLFVTVVLLLVPYLLIGLLGAAGTVGGATRGLFPELFPNTGASVPPGAVPAPITNAVICLVVLTYIFFGGVRGAAWANTLQTLVFLTVGVVAFYLIAQKLGGITAASEAVARHAPGRLVREGNIGKLQFLSYCFIPLSVAMFPHLFQHWMTARRAATFRLTVIAHPLCIMLLWAPCVLLGIWAAGAGIRAPNPNAVLGKMVGDLGAPLVTGLLTAGVLAAIMSSLDSQFLCLGTMFTNDIVIHHFGEQRFNDRQRVLLARGFIVLIVAITYVLSLFPPPHIFDLGVWCFSGFASLFPVVFAALYWKRATRAGAIAGILATVASWIVLFARDMILKSRGGGEDEILIFGLMPVTFIFAASTLAVVLVSLVTRPPGEATLRKFFPS